MNIKKCAFAATLVNNQFIYTFGGNNGTIYLNSIERYDISKDTWQLLDIKLNSSNYNCACFCAEPDKVIVLGGIPLVAGPLAGFHCM